MLFRVKIVRITGETCIKSSESTCIQLVKVNFAGGEPVYIFSSLDCYKLLVLYELQMVIEKDS